MDDLEEFLAPETQKWYKVSMGCSTYRGPKGHMNMRISHFGSKAQYKGDTRTCGFLGHEDLTFWFQGPVYRGYKNMWFLGARTQHVAGMYALDAGTVWPALQRSMEFSTSVATCSTGCLARAKLRHSAAYWGGPPHLGAA